MADVDVVLVSNYQSMLSLPFLFARHADFSPVIYATEPTILFARLLMQEMLESTEGTGSRVAGQEWRQEQQVIPFPVPMDRQTTLSLSPMFRSEDVARVMSRVETLALGQRVQLFGASVVAHSSGHSIGSCNWRFESPSRESVVYLSDSSTLTTHAKRMDTSLLLRQPVHALLLTHRLLTASPDPDSALLDLCSACKSTLQAQGNVLIPCFSTGLLYDVLHCLLTHALSDASLSHVPVFLVSGTIDQSLAYSNILSQWLTPSKESRVYLPEEPFAHSSFVRSGRVRTFSSLDSDSFSHELRTPCVVFAGHPSLRFGPVVHLLDMWSQGPENLLAFVEPEFPVSEALAPFLPLAIRVSVSLIDPRLTQSAAVKLLHEASPRVVVVPESVAHQEIGLSLDPQSLLPSKTGTWLHLPSSSSFSRLSLHPLLGHRTPLTLRPGLSLLTLTGSLEAKDHQLTLRPLSPQTNRRRDWTPGQESLSRPPADYATGSLDVQSFLSCLTHAGIHDSVLEQNRATGVAVIHLNGQQNETEALVTIDQNVTHIVCDVNSPLRLLLRDLVFKCLQSY